MPYYASAQALLGDARLRLDALGTSFGVLVVEGPDDKRLFASHCEVSAQIVVAGGRRLLLAALDAAIANDLLRMIFLTDCDFEVAAGTLHPRAGLVITSRADVEADLLAILLPRIAIEYVPAALTSPEDARRAAAALEHHSLAFAEVLGQIRQVAKPFGKPLDLDDIKYKRSRRPKSQDVDDELLIDKVGQQLGYLDLDAATFRSQVLAAPRGDRMVNGKDWLRAISFVLREDFGVTVDATAMSSFLRGCAAGAFADWEVIQRIRTWQQATARRLLTTQ